MKRKLTDKQVIRLRKMAATMRLVDVGKHFGLTSSGVSVIARGMTYGHVREGILPTFPNGQGLKEKWGNDYFGRMGTIGGTSKKTKPSGFAFMLANGQRKKIQDAGRLGGTISRRTKAR